MPRLPAAPAPVAHCHWAQPERHPNRPSRSGPVAGRQASVARLRWQRIVTGHSLNATQALRPAPTPVAGRQASVTRLRWQRIVTGHSLNATQTVRPAPTPVAGRQASVTRLRWQRIVTGHSPAERRPVVSRAPFGRERNKIKNERRHRRQCVTHLTNNKYISTSHRICKE